MDLGAVRQSIADALTPLGWSTWAFFPGDVGVLPAAVASVPTAINYGATLASASITLPLVLYVSAASLEDAQTRLDLALSTGNPESVYSALKTATNPAWRSVQVTGAGNVRLVKIGQSDAHACDINLELIA